MTRQRAKRRPKSKGGEIYDEAPDLREVFRGVSETMLGEFRRTAGAVHGGGRGALREERLRDFLRDHLPFRFGVGAGQLVHPSNLLSKQCDIVIYDRLNTPRLMPDETHSLFPVESVFAVIAVKSRLNSTELSDAFINLQSAFRVANDPSPYGPGGRWTGARSTGPSCFVFAYSCDRSLESVAQQIVAEWPSEGGRVRQPPPLVAALGKGLVGPPTWLMLNTALKDYLHVRATGSLSLLGFFMHLLGDLTGRGVSLPEFSFRSYLAMPQLLDGKRVWQHYSMSDFEQLPADVAIKDDALRQIIASCVKQPMLRFADFFADHLGRTHGTSSELAGKRTLVFNPKGIPLDIGRGETNPPRSPAAVITIGDDLYVIARGALEPAAYSTTPTEVVELFK